MALDPRVQGNGEEIKKLKKAVQSLAATVQGLAWRVASDEERNSLDIRGHIKQILEERD